MRPSFYLIKLEDFILDKVESIFFTKEYHYTKIGERKKSLYLKPIFKKMVDFKKSLKKKEDFIEWRGQIYGLSVQSYNSKDPTINGYIAEKGAIFNHADKKFYTNKKDYLASLKAMGKTIDDWR